MRWLLPNSYLRRDINMNIERQSYTAEHRDACVRSFVVDEMTYDDAGIKVAKQFGLDKPIPGRRVEAWVKRERGKAIQEELRRASS